MNILTFDIEEWYLEKINDGARKEKYLQFDETLKKVLDCLDEHSIKATFFCVGKLATEFPQVVRLIANRGHEVGCHSNEHTWLDSMSEEVLRKDTYEAIKTLEDVAGQKVTSYRAPSFTITQNNKWAINVLAECGITSDSSIFPTSRDFGGYKGFPQDTPCIISHEGVTMMEYPICQTTILGKKMAYSGGGYFRLLPYLMVSQIVKSRDYNICYFHLADLIKENRRMLSKEEHEAYYKEPGTFKNRMVRQVKNNIGIGDTFEKMRHLIEKHHFISVDKATGQIDWEKANRIEL